MKINYYNNWIQKKNMKLSQRKLLILYLFLGVPPHDYVSFFGMRAHDVLMGLLVSHGHQLLMNYQTNLLIGN